MAYKSGKNIDLNFGGYGAFGFNHLSFLQLAYLRLLKKLSRRIFVFAEVIQ